MIVIVMLIILWTIFSLGLFLLITKPTSSTSHSATLIDNILFTNNYDFAHTNGIIVMKSLLAFVSRYL